MFYLRKALGALFFLCSLFGVAYAAPSYCNSGLADPAPTVTDDGGGNLTDITIEGVTATNCYGVVNGNDSTAAISTIWGSGWGLAAKDDIEGSDDESRTINGILWTILADSDDGFYTGTMTITATDQNGDAAANLGDFFDLVLTLKAGRAYVTYLFEDIVAAAGADGTWEVNFLHPVSGQTSALSHITLYAQYDGEGPPNDVPEPGSLALAGLALAGLTVTKRRRSNVRA